MRLLRPAPRTASPPAEHRRCRRPCCHSKRSSGALPTLTEEIGSNLQRFSQRPHRSSVRRRPAKCTRRCTVERPGIAGWAGSNSHGCAYRTGGTPAASERSIADSIAALARQARADAAAPHRAPPEERPHERRNLEDRPGGRFEDGRTDRVRGVAHRRRRRERRIDPEALLGEDGERRVVRAEHRPLGRPERRHRPPDGFLRRVAAPADVRAELRGSHLEDAPVRVAVAADLVPGLRDALDERRALARDPAEDEERGTRGCPARSSRIRSVPTWTLFSRAAQVPDPRTPRVPHTWNQSSTSTVRTGAGIGRL